MLPAMPSQETAPLPNAARRRRVLPLLALALAAPVVAMAAGATEPAPADQPIGLDEWRALTDGRTVHYEIGGQLWGREHFHKGRDSATFVAPDGQCMTAPWAYAEGVYCFAYQGMDCFRHVRRGGRLFAVPLSGEGGAQEIVRITDEPLSCEPPLAM
jgi:hypothetical protein